MVVISVNTPSDRHTPNDDLELTVLLAALIFYRKGLAAKEKVETDEIIKGTVTQHKWLATGLALRVGEILNLSIPDVLELFDKPTEVV